MLIRANLALFALLIAHTVDHAVNQPVRELPATGTLVGVAAFAIVAASTVLALYRSPIAPPAAILSGLVTALGLVAVHLAPRWSEPISDPYWDFDANALSWALAAAPLLAGLGLAAIASRVAMSHRRMNHARA